MCINTTENLLQSLDDTRRALNETQRVLNDMKDTLRETKRELDELRVIIPNTVAREPDANQADQNSQESSTNTLALNAEEAGHTAATVSEDEPAPTAPSGHTHAGQGTRAYFGGHAKEKPCTGLKSNVITVWNNNLVAILEQPVKQLVDRFLEMGARCPRG